MIHYIQADLSDAQALAEIRAVAMKPSLEALGRFDESRVRRRFLDTFIADETFKIIENESLVGFFVVREREDHVYLDHLYIKPEYQGRRIGQKVLQHVISHARTQALPVRLGALRESRSNQFYLQNGFHKTHEDEFDVYYEFTSP